MDYVRIVHGFDRISFRTHNSSLEGAMKLKFAPLEMPFPMTPFLAEVKFFSFCPKTMDYNPRFQS